MEPRKDYCIHMIDKRTVLALSAWRPFRKKWWRKLKIAGGDSLLLKDFTLLEWESTGWEWSPTFFLISFPQKSAHLQSSLHLQEEKTFSRAQRAVPQGGMYFSPLHGHVRSWDLRATTELCKACFPSRWEALFSVGRYWLLLDHVSVRNSPIQVTPFPFLLLLIQMKRLWSEDFPVANRWLGPCFLQGPQDQSLARELRSHLSQVSPK